MECMPRMADCGGLMMGVERSAAVHAAVGDGEGAAGHVVDADRAVARLFAQRVDRSAG